MVKADWHFIIHEVEAASGNYKGTIHLNGKGTAEGIGNDNKYFWSNNYTFSYQLGSGESLSNVQTFKVIGKGNADKGVLKIHYKFAVNANGQPTVNIDKFELNCH